MTGLEVTAAAITAARVSKKIYDVAMSSESLEAGKGISVTKQALSVAATAFSPGGTGGLAEMGRSVEGFRKAVGEVNRHAANLEGSSKGLERIGGSVALRRNLEASDIKAPEGAQAQHIVPCQVMRDSDVGEWLRNGESGNDVVDEARNGEFLPETAGDRAHFPGGDKLPIHRGPHPEYNREVHKMATRVAEQLRQRYGGESESLSNVPDDMRDKVYDKLISAAKKISRSPGVQTAEGRLR